MKTFLKTGVYVYNIYTFLPIFWMARPSFCKAFQFRIKNSVQYDIIIIITRENLNEKKVNVKSM